MKHTLVQSALALAVTSIMAMAHADKQTTDGTEGVTKLNTIVVTASGSEQNIADAAASISVITGEELEKKSYNDVTDALKNIPGVNIIGNGPDKSISIRGMGADYTLFLIDGKPAQGGDAYKIRGGYPGAQVSYMPPVEAIERIEVIRGPASALYGSDAIGGVINIITKKHSNKLTASLRTEYTKAASSNIVNNDTKNTTVYVNAPLIDKMLSFQFNAGLMDRDEKDNAGRTSSVSGADSEFKRENVSGKFILTPNEHNTISAGYSYNLQERNTTPGKSIAEGTLNAMTGAFTANTASGTKIERTNINVDHQLEYDKFTINSYITRDNDKSFTQGNEFETIIANTQGAYLFSNNTLTVGANYKKEKIHTDGQHNASGITTDLERYQWALFAEDTWQATEDLALTLSGRYDENEVFGGEFSPKAYAVYKLTDGLNLKGGVTSGYKAPSLRNSFPDFAEASMGGAMLGNPDLTPEKSLNYEAGIAYENPSIGLSGSFMVFKTDFKDKIMRTGTIDGSTIAGSDFYQKYPQFPVNTAGYTTYYNVGKSESKGIELTTEYSILDNLKYRQAYTYNKTEIKDGARKGEAFTDSPKHMFNAGLDYDLNDQVLLWTQLNYNGKTGGSEVGAQGSLGLAKRSYTTIDLGTVYNYDKKLQFLVGVYNITNERNKEADLTLNTTDERDIDGRRYSIAMNLKF